MAYDNDDHQTQEFDNTYEVFVSNLNFDTTEEALREFFEESGEITNISMPVFKDSGRPRGFAFVRFTNNDSVDNALELAGSELDGREINVRKATSKPSGGFRGGRGGGGHRSGGRGGYGSRGGRGYGGGYGDRNGGGYGDRSYGDRNNGGYGGRSRGGFRGGRGRGGYRNNNSYGGRDYDEE